MNKLTDDQISAEMDKFEALFPIPSHTRRIGDSYAVSSFNAWDGHKYCDMWEGWKARAEIALPVLEQQGGWISCSERIPEIPNGWLYLPVIVFESDDVKASEAEYWADGFKSRDCDEILSLVTHWQTMPLPPQPSTNPQIDNDGWIEWGGGNSGEMPVDEADRVEVRWSSGETSKGRASNFGWANRVAQGFHSIIAYRVIEQQERERGEEE